MGRFLLIAMALAGTVATQPSHAAESCPVTTPAQNEELVRRFIDTVYNGHAPQALPEFYADDFNRVNPARPQKNLPGLDDDIARVGRSLAEFPDLKGIIDETIAVDDRVVVLLTYEGTNRGAFNDWKAPATGRTAKWQGVQIMRIACGKIVENIVVADRLTQLRQLGIISDDELSTVTAPN